MKNLSIVVEDEFHKKIKMLASEKGITIKELMCDVLKNYLSNSDKEKE